MVAHGTNFSVAGTKSNRMVMSHQEMMQYIKDVGRTELFQELEDLRNKNYSMIRRNTVPSSRYLKAICVSLVALGYDEQWVDTTFRDALETEYLS